MGNRERFPDPASLTQELRQAGFHSVAILDPGVVADASDATCASGLAGEHFVRSAQGELVRGRVWPGLCYFPDFARAATRSWWSELVRAFATAAGIDGLWNDMNEPALFRTPTRTLPTTAVHDGGRTSHAHFHNLYGQRMAEATRAGLQAARPTQRPFVLTRAGHLATARFAATWTGDNQSRFEDLAWSIPMVLGLGLSGQPFAGPDVGGFSGDPDEELFVRWFELGALLPFCRGHAEQGTCRKEPWSFGKRALEQVRAALERRMRLLPTLYSLFHEAHRAGLPIVRPLFFLDPSDPQLRTIDDAFLLGDQLLVAPVVQRASVSREVRLPAGGWYAFDPLDEWQASVAPRFYQGATSSSLPAPPGSTPILARAGSIVVTSEARLHTGLPANSRRLHVHLDRAGNAAGQLYEDAGHATDQRSCQTARWTFEATRAGTQAQLCCRRTGQGTSAETDWEWVVESPDGMRGRAYGAALDGELRVQLSAAD